LHEEMSIPLTDGVNTDGVNVAYESVTAERANSQRSEDTLEGEDSVGLSFDSTSTRKRRHRGSVMQPAEAILKEIMSNRMAQGLSALPHDVKTKFKNMPGVDQLENSQLISMVRSKVDPSLMFAMERTFLSSLNHAFGLMVIATKGFMSIEDAINLGDDKPANLGAFIFCIAIVYVVISYFFHFRRLIALSRGETITMVGSLMWLGLLVLLVLLTCIAQITYIYVYPLDERSKKVEILSNDPPPSPSALPEQTAASAA
jgi:uncharacterized membrane protein YidH (DUF202 family)